jgi:hypothetical protein
MIGRQLLRRSNDSINDVLTVDVDGVDVHGESFRGDVQTGYPSLMRG